MKISDKHSRIQTYVAHGCILIMVLIILILLPFAVILSDTLIREKNSQKALPAFAEQLTGYPLPSETVCLEDLQAVGSLTGMGNHRRYEVVMLVRSGLSQDNLENYYILNNLLSPKESDRKDITIHIVPISRWKEVWLDLVNIRDDHVFASWKAMEQEKDCYLISMIKGPIPILEMEGVYYELKRDGIIVIQKTL